MGYILDITVCLCCICIAVVGWQGMFGNVEGGNRNAWSKEIDWFAWHPFLMTFAFPCLMVLGRYMNATESLVEKSSRQSAHRMMMILGAFTAVLGYVCIFKAHLPKQQFVGYDFINDEWKPRARVAHVVFGYGSIVLVLLQVPIGIIKFEYAKSGQKILRVHGLLGKIILAMASTAILIAIYFWAWTRSFKLVFGALVLVCLTFGIFWPPFNATTEETPLVGEVSDATKA